MMAASKRSSNFQKLDSSNKRRHGRTLTVSVLLIFTIMVVSVPVYFYGRHILISTETAYRGLYQTLDPKDSQTGQADEDGERYILLALGDYAKDGRLGDKFIQHLAYATVDKSNKILDLQFLHMSDKNQFSLSQQGRQKSSMESMIASLKQSGQLDPDYYILIDMSESISWLDQITPVQVTLDQDINQDGLKYYAGKRYDLSSKVIKKVLQDASGDYDQVQRQVFLALIAEGATYSHLPKLAKVFELARGSVMTDIPFSLVKDLYLNYNLKILSINVKDSKFIQVSQ